MHFKHATKKRFNKSTTSKKTINTGISAEFTDYRRRLDSASTALKNFVKQIRTSRVVWTAVAKHQSDFSAALTAALPQDGVVRVHSHEVEDTIRNMQRRINDDDGSGAPHQRMISVLEAYLKLLDTVEADYKAVEMSYTETLRYQRKVEKLEKKGDKKREQRTRNLGKLSSARAEYETKLTAVLKRMHAAFDKHEAIFQCAHHAFWMANDTYANIIFETTRNIRAESVQVHDRLVDLDVARANTLTPIPRMMRIEDKPEEGSPGPVVMEVVDHSQKSSSSSKPTDSIDGQVQPLAPADSPTAPTHTVVLTPETPTVSVSVAAPDVPTEMPAPPSNPKMTTATTVVSPPQPMAA